MLNHIAKTQNTERFINLLRARTEIYASATRFQVSQLACAVILPFVGGLVALSHEPARPFVALASVLLTLLDVSFLDRIQRTKLKLAAKVSEQFDCELFQLEWNKFVCGKKIDPESIGKFSREYRGKQSKLENWYPDVVSGAPLYIARLVCQRTNVWYDSKLRSHYGLALLLIAGGLSIALATSALLAQLAPLDFVTSAILPAAPIFIWAIRDYFRQSDAADSSAVIRSEAESLLESIEAKDYDEAEATLRAREFQDAIYGRRSTAPLLLPFVYKLLRPGMEVDMNSGAAEIMRRIEAGRARRQGRG